MALIESLHGKQAEISETIQRFKQKANPGKLFFLLLSDAQPACRAVPSPPYK